jgi:hypothetical protein
MSIATTTSRAIYTGVPVLLNLGFSQSKFARKSKFEAYPVMCRIYVEGLSQVLEPGWKASVMHGNEERETTLIVTGVFNYAADHTDLLWAMVERACQDCIAIYYPDEDIGFLFGPEAAAWGEFDINQFVKGEWQ